MSPRERFGPVGRLARLRRRALAVGAVGVALVLSAAGCGWGDTGSGAASGGPDDTEVAAGDVALFDAEVVHDLAIDVDPDDLDAMVATFEETGDKTWIEATVTIDGATYERAGIRLKGNSSLRGVATADPVDLPWLIRLDRFVDGQTHQRYEDIVVRSNGSETSLNEAVALDLLAEAGLASEAAAPARFIVGGSDPRLRLIVEHPDDDEWSETTFDGLGALYKSESTGDWSYRGDDPASYDEVFDQEGGKDVADLTPLIDLLRFLDEADDDTFAAELDERLDVDAFASYLAMMELVANFDDIDGPGNNSYLWWDAGTERFTVVPWDLNLAFGTGMGGGAGGSGGAPGGGGFPGGLPGGGPEGGGGGGGSPGGAGGPGGPGGDPPGAMRPEGGGGGPGGFGRSNPLVERFHADDGFQALYEERLADLRAELFDGGRAQEILDARASVLVEDAADLVDADTVQSEADAIAATWTG